jgi:hypothetical protein
MRIEIGHARETRNKDQKLLLVRRATTAASNNHGIGGRPKSRGKPKPITMPKMKFLDGGSK